MLGSVRRHELEAYSYVDQGNGVGSEFAVTHTLAKCGMEMTAIDRTHVFV